MQNVCAAHSPSQTVAVALGTPHHEVSAQTSHAYEGVNIGKPPSLDKLTRQEKHWSLQLHSLKHSQSLVARVQKRDKRTNTEVANFADNVA